MGFENDDPFYQLDALSQENKAKEGKDAQSSVNENQDPEQTSSDSSFSGDQDPFDQLGDGSEEETNTIVQGQNADPHLGMEEEPTSGPIQEYDPFDDLDEQFSTTSATTQSSPSINPSQEHDYDPFDNLDKEGSGQLGASPTAMSTVSGEVSSETSPVDIDLGFLFNEPGEHQNALGATSDFYELEGIEHPFIPGTDSDMVAPSGHDVLPEEEDPFEALIAKLKKGKEFVENFKDKIEDLQGFDNTSTQESTVSNDYQFSQDPLDSPMAFDQGNTETVLEPTPGISEDFTGKSYMEALDHKLFFDRDQQNVSADENEEARKKIAYLKNKINLDRIKYRGQERHTQRWALIFRLLSSALAAVVTVLLGINVTDTLRDWGVDWWINTTALVISAFISIIGVIQGFFDANELFVKYTDTANKLEQILSTIEYLELGEKRLGLYEVNYIKIEYDRIIESTHNYEMIVRAEESSIAKEVHQQGTIQDTKKV